ncbi:MAG: ABC transporter permease [Herbinix sp.]|nr:ABC transporter permease [Herbinix sp.]
MMKSKLWRSLSDIIVLFLLRIKLIMKDITTVVVLCGSILLFALMLQSMSSSAESLSSLPVGIVDYDKSSSSKELIHNLKNIEALRIVEINEEELNKLLMDEMIYSIFVIEKGYEESLLSGNLKDIITMHYNKDNKSASILSDIVAGEIIYPASLYKGYHYYKQVPFTGQKLSLMQYKDYMDNIVGVSNDFNFAFQMNYANLDKTMVKEEQLSNSVVYDQLIFGILGILIAFVAMFVLSQTVKEKEMGVEIRLKISRFHILKRDIANLCALLSFEGVIAFLFSILIFRQLSSKNLDLWFSAYLLLILNALVMGGIMQLIAKVVKRMLLYQVFCSITILMTGGLGFYYLLNGFYQGIADNMVKIIPNSWFIMGFTDIIVYSSEGGYLKEGHKILLLMAAVIIILVIGIDLIQGFHKKHFQSN